MKIKIYQIDRDKDNGSLSFLNYENTVKRTGGRIRSEIYHKVFDGDVECSGLEDVYFMFNENRPESFTGHSLSVSDIVEIENSDIVEKGYYFCDSFGFKKIDFEPSLAVESKKEQITVVICEPGKLARVANIGTELTDLQAVVGGNIETFYPYEEQVCIVCDDEGKICGKPLNRAIYNEDGTIMDITVKTAQQTAKTTVKTAEKTAKAAKKTAEASARAAKMAAQAARQAAQAAYKAAVVTAKAVAAAVKAAIAGIKALAAAIAAGGWVAVVIIIVICLVALIAGSCFGIFLSGDDTGNGLTVQTVVSDINAEYEAKINETKGMVAYDVLEMSGTRAVWPDVLSIYAVKTAGDPNNPQEVATIDESKRQILKEIFWAMNEISFSTATKTENVITETDDGNGNIVETTESMTRTYLYIRVSHKSPDEMAAQYGFTDAQKEQLRELLSEENKNMWSGVLYGYKSGGEDIVSVALSQLGNEGGQPYWSWYGFNSRVEWCCCFVSYV